MSKKDRNSFESNDVADDFLDKKKQNKNKKIKTNHEVDLSSYIADDFDETLLPKRSYKVQEEEPFITDITKKEVEPLKSSENIYDDFAKPERLHTEEIPKIKKETIQIERKTTPRKVKKKFNIFISFFFTIMFLASFLFVGYAILFGSEHAAQTELIINSVLVLFLCIFMVISYNTKKEGAKKRFAFLGTITMTGFIAFNLLTSFNILKLPENKVMKDFTGKTIMEALTWAEANHVKINQKYDNREKFEAYSVIKQDVYPNTLLKDVKEITFIVSDGPDYNKEVSISDMVGWNIDEAVKIIDTNFLNNVNINYKEDEETSKDIILLQSKKGTMKRNDELNLDISIGKKDDLTEVSMEDLKNMTQFKALLWLKRNGIPFEIKKEFSDTTLKGKVMKQSIKKGTKVSKDSSPIEITISKGKKIIVPDLKTMSTKQITKWIVENKLKIEFSDKYDSKIKKGKVVESNYKEKDEIEEGTLIKIVTSKGQLTLPEFKDLASFRAWANQYGILFREEYQQNKDIEKGKIINFSAKPGDVLNPEEEMVVYISTGSTISIPNFVGKTKVEIEKTCKNIGINCTFYYAGMSTKDRDIALSQNKRAGSEVLKDTYVNIGLSSGKTSGNGNINTGTDKPSGGGSTKPTPTPTPPPSCNKTTFYILPNYISINNPEQTCSNVKNAYSGYKINCSYVDSDSGKKGQILNSASLNGSEINSCTAITLQIKNN